MPPPIQLVKLPTAVLKSATAAVPFQSRVAGTIPTIAGHTRRGYIGGRPSRTISEHFRRRMKLSGLRLPTILTRPCRSTLVTSQRRLRIPDRPAGLPHARDQGSHQYELGHADCCRARHGPGARPCGGLRRAHGRHRASAPPVAVVLAIGWWRWRKIEAQARNERMREDAPVAYRVIETEYQVVPDPAWRSAQG